MKSVDDLDSVAVARDLDDVGIASVGPVLHVASATPS